MHTETEKQPTETLEGPEGLTVQFPAGALASAGYATRVQPEDGWTFIERWHSYAWDFTSKRWRYQGRTLTRAGALRRARRAQ